MSLVITIAQLEDAINRARKQQPALDNVLQPDVNALAEIYGRMLYQKTDLADLDRVPARVRQAVINWLPAAETDPAASPQSCVYRPGDPDFESCESCQ
jgi:hypothetical protein